MTVTMVTYTEAWNIALEASKPLSKMWKYKISIFYALKKTNLMAEKKTHSNR